MMTHIEDITSERFIHRDLLRQAGAAIAAVYGIWRKERKITPTLFTWPSERIQTDSGEPHEGVCILELPAGSAERTQAVQALVERTKAYALLLIEQHAHEVRAIFESKHGTRTWTIPIVVHGDVAILEKARAKDDEKYVGLLWSPTLDRV